MIDDELRWAETLALIEAHEDGTLSYVQGRLEELTRQEDQAGLERLRQIVIRLERLLDAEKGARH